MRKSLSIFTNNFTPDIIVRGYLYAIGMGIPILVGLFCHLQQELAFVAMGAMFSLRLDPRDYPKRQVIAILGGMVLMIASASLGALLIDHKKMAIAVFIFISFLAGQPKSEQAYLSLLGKFIAASLLLTEMGIPASINIAIAYFSGAVFALILTLLQDNYFPAADACWDPQSEWRKLMTGDINGPLFGLTLPLTILAAVLTAKFFHAQHISWAGLTVLFVMHVNDATTWAKIRQRIVGTLLGVLLSYVIILYFPIYSYGIILCVCAFFIPFSLKTNYLLLSMVVTTCVLIVIDIAMLKQGGDMLLIKWRFLDTLIGGIWVAISLTLLRIFKACLPTRSHLSI